jgi:hypothetical protein
MFKVLLLLTIMIIVLLIVFVAQTDGQRAKGIGLQAQRVETGQGTPQG